jgi:xanthine dehydrogenase accessory factor
MNEQSAKYFARVRELTENQSPFVSVTFIDSRGYAPQDQGAKALVTRDGLCEGTIGGGRLEAKAILRAQELLLSEEKKTRDFVTWNLQRDVGMSCGGEVSLFFEVFNAKQWQIAVFGAGHVAQSLVRLLMTLDCRVTCLDSRAEWLDRLPQGERLKKVCAQNLPAEVTHLAPDSYLLLMTQGHATDLPILLEILRTRVPHYLGVIGSDVKGKKLRQELKEAGFTPEQISVLRCPMGLPLGGNSPGEIAVSMAAQILQVRDQSRIFKDEQPEQPNRKRRDEGHFEFP